MSAPRRSFRYADETRWQLAKARAESEGTTVTDVLSTAVDEYVDGWEPYGTVVIGKGEQQAEPACRGRNDGQPCDCVGFVPGKSPLRCKECGHVKGVHR